MDDLAVMDDLDLAIPRRGSEHARDQRKSSPGTILSPRKQVNRNRVPSAHDRPATLMTEGYFLMLSWAQTDALRRCAANGETVLIEMADGSRCEFSDYPRRPT
jgi:hypothetical protein